MNRKWIQLFAAGWFSAVCVITAVYYAAAEPLNSKPIEQEQHAANQQELNKKNAISFLEKQDYKIMTTEDYKALKEQNKTTTVTKAILHIEEGMNSDDVAALLEDLQMIDTPAAFKAVLNDSGKTTSIQAGTYEVNNQMTHHDILKLITQ